MGARQSLDQTSSPHNASSHGPTAIAPSRNARLLPSTVVLRGGDSNATSGRRSGGVVVGRSLSVSAVEGGIAALGTYTADDDGDTSDSSEEEGCVVSSSNPRHINGGDAPSSSSQHAPALSSRAAKGRCYSHCQPRRQHHERSAAPRQLAANMRLPRVVGLALFDIKCPVCHKVIPSDDAEIHLVMCLTRPKLTYNDDVLSEDKGECIICLEDLVKDDAIARLPCLCIYHKKCIDSWFTVKNNCPEHPGDE